MLAIKKVRLCLYPNTNHDDFSQIRRDCDKRAGVKVIKMDDKESLQKSEVAEIFQTMSYGENVDDLNKVSEWLRSKDKIFTYVEKGNEPVNGIPKELKNIITDETLCTIYMPEIDVIKRILSKCSEKIKWSDTPAFERTKLLYRLAIEIEQNVDLLAQIETVTRGILAKDTKRKVLPLLAQYFYYYSGFSVRYNEENPNYKPPGVSVAVISNENALSNIGLFLAPALAAGHNIILQIGSRLFLSALFILELAQKVGIPQDAFKLIPSDDGELLPYFSSDNVATVTLFVDINNEKYRGINNLNKKILTLASYKSPILIFDDADLDSACENAVDSVWGYNGLHLGSVDTILIQQNIFDIFLDKLKTKLQFLKIGLAHDKLADISNAIENSSFITLAKNLGLEVFQADKSTNSPVLVIGSRIHSKISEQDKGNFASVLTFRSIDEAVSLANNTKQGLGASVWSENIGVINEVIRKLKVANVWVNSICIITADVTFSPMKNSGVGFYGGVAGFYEYVQVKSVKSNVEVKEESLCINNSVITIINKAKKAQENWRTLSKINKNKIFQQFAEYIESNKKQSNGTLDEKSSNLWISEIYRWITTPCDVINTPFNAGYGLTTIREPRGVLAIELGEDTNISNIAFILSAISQGNSILLLSNGSPTHNLYSEFSKRLPGDVLNLIPYNLSNIKTISAHKDVSTYFGCSPTNSIFSSLPIQDSQMFTCIDKSWSSGLEKNTIFLKNIWSDIGKSSNCSLSG